MIHRSINTKVSKNMPYIISTAHGDRVKEKIKKLNQQADSYVDHGTGDHDWVQAQKCVDALNSRSIHGK